MQVKRIRIKNFKSIGGQWTEYNFTNDGCHLIRGVPGTGKTTILSAITFVLFGKSTDYKGNSKSTIPTSGLVNDINKKEMIVECYLDNGFTIIRGLKPDVFKILNNEGNDLAEYSSKRIDQEFVEQNILNGLTLDVFLNTIYISAKPASVPFIYMSGMQRKDYIEKILDLSIINNMNEHLKSYIYTSKLEINTLSSKIKMLENQKVTEERKYEEEKFNYSQKVKEQQQYEVSKKEKLESINLSIIALANSRVLKETEIADLKREESKLKENFTESNCRFKESFERLNTFNIEQIKNKEALNNEINESEESLKVKDFKISEDLNKEFNGLIFQLDMMQGDLNNFEISNFNEERYNLKVLTLNETILELQQIKDNILELQTERDKKQMEMDTFSDNKGRYHMCGTCPTLSKIIGNYDINEAIKFVNTCNLYIDNLENNIKEKLIIKNNLEKMIDDFNFIKEKIVKQEKEKYDLEHRISKTKDKISLVEMKIKQEESDFNFKIDNIKSKISNIKDKIQNFDTQSLNNKESLIREIYNEYIKLNQECNNELQNLIHKIDSNTVLKIEVQTQKYNLPSEPKYDYVNKVIKDLSTCNFEFDKEYNKSVELSDLKAIINDKEHKAKALESILPIFEKKINTLLEMFMEDDEFTVTAKLQNDFELVFFKNNKEINIFSLSAGQQQCVSLASTFSFIYLLGLKHNNNFNHLFIDEILDMSLGVRGPLIIRYLKQISNHKNINIISHNTSLPFELFDSITNVQKDGPFTKYSKEI